MQSGINSNRWHPGEIGSDPLRVPSDVRACIHEHGLTLLQISRGLVFTANHTGGRIWQGLVSGKTISTVAMELSRDFGVNAERAERQIADFVSSLLINKLLARAQ